MKNRYCGLRLSVLFLIVFIQILPAFSQQIVQVGAGEYFTSYRTNTGRLMAAKWGTSVPAIHDFGLSNVIDVDGAQYTNVALTASGNVYVVGVSGSVNAYATLVPTDNLGQPFTGNTKVYGLYQCYLTIRNGNVWYWGIGDVLNMNGGANLNTPKQLQQPPGKTMVKLVPASATMFGGLTFLWGLASDGTVWQWDRTHQTPFQVTFPGNIAEDITMVGPMSFVVKTSNDLYAWGFDPSYAGGRPTWQQSGIQSIKAAWQAAGAVFPLKEIVGNYNTLHIIDANDHMFASGSNPQGNIGNGIQYNPWRTARTPWQWDWSNGQLMTPPTQIPGKFKNIQTSNTITFYLYVQDMGDNWYSWGRNKAMSLGNGKTLSINDYAIYPEGLNVPAPTLVTPLTQVWSITPFNPTGQQPPLSHAGVNQYISASSTTLYGSGSSQQEGHLTSYTWSKVSGPAATIVSPNAVNTQVSGLTSGTYVFRLTVVNNFGASHSSTVTVVVGSGTPANVVPVANAGSDRTITLPTTSTSLSGSGTDADGTIASIQWTKISGPAGGNLSAPASYNTNVTALSVGVYAFQLELRDDDGAIGRDTVNVTVLPAPNQAPTVIVGSDIQITLPVNEVALEGSAIDNDGTVISTLWTMISNGSGSIQDPVEVSTMAVGLEPGLYTFILSATDDDGGVGRDTMQVLVNALQNEPPVAVAGSNQVVTLPDNTVTLNGDGVDPDGNIVALQWRKVAGSTANIQNPTSGVTAVTGLAQDTYKFELTVTDDMGASAKDTMQITVNPAPNQAPVANAGNDITITLPAGSFQLIGSGTDVDGTITAYLWQRISGPNVTLSNAFSSTATVTNLVEGTYSFRLRVTDNNGATAVDVVNVTILPVPNQAPVANAGTDITITLPVNNVQLSGSGTDADGNVASYQWLKISGGNAVIQSPASASSQVTGLEQGTYIFQLTITDDDGAGASDLVQVTVLEAPNQAPVANAGNDHTITLPVNFTQLSGSATDVDGTIASWRWTKISGPFASIANVASQTTNITGMLAGLYQFELRVIDNDGAVDRDTVLVSVMPEPNQLPVVNAGNDQTIVLPTNFVTLSATATDPDGSINSFTWRKIAGSTANISNTLSATTSVTSLVQGTYRFEIAVRDNDNATVKDTVQVTVLPAPNVPPTANAGSDITITLPVNSVQLAGSGNDVDGTISSYNWVKISGGAASIANAASASTTVSGLVEGSYSFRLTVTDNSGATANDVINVTVLAAPNAAPTANAGNDITITLPTNSIILNGSGTDVDGTIAGYQWVKLSGGTANIISAGSASSNVSGLVQGSYSFQLTVTDNSGATATDVVNVSVLAAPNVPPTANAGSNITITLPTNSVTLNGSGTDVDGVIATYSWVKLSGGSANISNANSATSNVTGLVQGSYSFQLTVTDNSGASATDVMNVTVLPAPNVAPMVNAGADQVITLPINQVTLNGSAIDADGSIASYSWIKVNGPAAFISNASSSTTTVLGLGEGVYTFRLTVRDNSGATASDDVQVTVVRNANIAPVANAGNDIEVHVPVSTADLSGSASDADGVVLTYNWIKITGPAGGFVNNALSQSTQITGLVPGEYSYQLVVTDNDGAIGRDTVIVSVVEATGNMAPVVNAGPDLTVLLPISSVELHGSAIDHDGDVVAYRWKVVSGPAGTWMNGEHRSNLILNALQQGVYTIVLQAWDNLGAVGTDTMLLYVNHTQVTEELPKDFVRIFPNPVGPRLTVHIRSYHQGRRAKLLVVDMYGRPMAENIMVINQFVNINQVNVAHLAPGWYTLKIISEGYPTISLPLLKR